MADFNDESAIRYGRQLIAARKQAEAKLAEAEADGNAIWGAEVIEEIADIDAKGESLNRLHRSYHQQPVHQERESVITARRAPSDGNDALEILNYGKLPNDPTRLSAEEYNRQLGELGRLKAKGMYRD
jgi:hypothetical protein